MPTFFYFLFCFGINANTEDVGQTKCCEGFGQDDYFIMDYNVKQLDNAKGTFKLRMEHKRLTSDIIIVCRTYV